MVMEQYFQNAEGWDIDFQIRVQYLVKLLIQWKEEIEAL
jgi:hypothetical protein